MDYKNPIKAGRLANLRGIKRSGNPINQRTEANARRLWDQGWVA